MAMSDRLFRDVFEPPVNVRSQQRCTTLLSIVAHTILIGAAIIVPAVAGATLPPLASPMMASVIAAPLPQPMVPPASTARTPPTIRDAAAAPVDAPSTIAPESYAPSSAELPITAGIGAGFAEGA